MVNVMTEVVKCSVARSKSDCDQQHLVDNNRGSQRLPEVTKTDRLLAVSSGLRLVQSRVGRSRQGSMLDYNKIQMS